MLLKWAGGKAWLVNNHPYVFHSNESYETRSLKYKSIKFKRYIDPFLGGGAVFKYLEPDQSIISDVNEEMITFYNCLKSSPEALYKEVIKHFKKHSRTYYYEVRKTLKKDELGIAARFLYLNYTCYNGIYRVNQKNEFNVPIGDKKGFHYVIDDFIRNSAKLKNAKIKLQDFRDTISLSRKDDLLYVDPPYTTKINKSAFTSYSAKNFSWKDQEDLSLLLNQKNSQGVKIIISNINDKDIRKLYSSSKGWVHRPIDRANSLALRQKGKRYKEIIISNI